jgi:hypothetical protein
MGCERRLGGGHANSQNASKDDNDDNAAEDGGD